MIDYRDARPADGPELAAMAARCFTDTFGTLYRASDLKAFLDQAFGVDGLPSQLDDPAYQVRLALEDGKIIGFAKLGPVDFPGDWGADTRELHQLYVLGPWQGVGVSRVLMDWCIGQARGGGHAELVLSVYTENWRAQRFYEKYGFVDVGPYEFMVGEHVDQDRIWKLAL